MNAAYRTGRVTLACIGLAGLFLFAGPACAADDAQLASHYGCLNCHMSQDGFAPSVKRLSTRMGREGDQPKALQAMLGEMREHSAIHTHQMVSDEAALGVLRWLAQGAK
ncbi:MAG: hypothetical protein ACXWKD_12700 [Caldimonas sp.]